MSHRLGPIFALSLLILASFVTPSLTSASTLEPMLAQTATARAAAVSSQVPSQILSFYVPQAGPVATPTEGTDAIRFFRACPNNDGQSSLPNNARIKVVLRDNFGRAIAGVAAADICILFNGGTPEQGFSGEGADSIIANSQWNSAALCPDVRCLSADAPTDATGKTYITFAGADPANPGVTRRDPNRKWGHFDSELPVFALGIKLSGRLSTDSANDSYTLRIKNVDWTGGLTAVGNQGEAVTISDLNGLAASFMKSTPWDYWKDLDSSGYVSSTDLSILTSHLNHNCARPFKP